MAITIGICLRIVYTSRRTHSYNEYTRTILFFFPVSLVTCVDPAFLLTRMTIITQGAFKECSRKYVTIMIPILHSTSRGLMESGSRKATIIYAVTKVYTIIHLLIDRDLSGYQPSLG